MNVTVLGAGRWGSFLAWYADKRGHDVTLWGREGGSFEALHTTRQNAYLSLADGILLTSDLGEALAHAHIVLLAVAAQSLRDVLARAAPLAPPDATFVLCAKGLESGTGKRLSQVFFEAMGPKPLAVWVGPGHVQAFVAGEPNCMVVDSHDETTKRLVVDAFSGGLIRFYYGVDMVGSELGAATKNIVGLAAGMLDGLNLPSLKGALMARAPREISRLIEAEGGNGITAYGLAHLGDYEATLFSEFSQNRQFGLHCVRHAPYRKLAEGVHTLAGVRLLAQKHKLDMPIVQCVHSVLIEGKDARVQLFKLFERTQKSEFM